MLVPLNLSLVEKFLARAALDPEGFVPLCMLYLFLYVDFLVWFSFFILFL